VDSYQGYGRSVFHGVNDPYWDGKLMGQFFRFSRSQMGQKLSHRKRKSLI
jgi:hypothetical protein